MKFDGILLCTDLDDTLLREDKSVSEENIKAIEYFKENGGTFTFITGRTYKGVKHVIDLVKPNAPICCHNGGSICDFENERNLMEIELDKACKVVIDRVLEKFPSVGIEVVTHERNYFCKRNFRVDEHQRLEFLPTYEDDYHNVGEKWAKILFMDEKPVIDELIPFIDTLEEAKPYDFVRSTDYYYELLPKNVSKGNSLLRLADILGIDRNKTVAVGDNENDISMIKSAKVGYAVANGAEKAKQAADIITVTNMDHAIARIIDDIDKKRVL